jgi:hypothetical protein
MGLSLSVGLALTFAIPVGAMIPTFAGATSSTTVNGAAGPTPATVQPFPMQAGGIYSLEQFGAAGSDVWVIGPNVS